jgi:cytochrome c-type biogenesis protein
MNITITIAFFAGLISFLSPCVLPLIPGYISYISGTSLDKIKGKKKNIIIIKTVFFTVGFSLVFIALGSAASFIGQFFLSNSYSLRIIAGIIIIFF